MSMQEDLRPDSPIFRSNNKPVVIRQLINLVRERFRVADFQATFGQLLTFSDDEIRAALKVRGMRREWVEDLFFDLDVTRQWKLPIGARKPMEPGWDKDLEDDANYEAKNIARLEKPYMRVPMAPTWLRTIERLLKESDLPEAAVAAKGLEDSFLRAGDELSIDLEGRPSDTDWRVSEGGYRLRVSGLRRPMIRVYRRWDGQVGIFPVTIVQQQRLLGVGAFIALIDVDSTAEVITWDQKSFAQCERAVHKTLETRMPVRRHAHLRQKTPISPGRRSLGAGETHSESLIPHDQQQ